MSIRMCLGLPHQAALYAAPVSEEGGRTHQTSLVRREDGHQMRQRTRQVGHRRPMACLWHAQVVGLRLLLLLLLLAWCNPT